ncbi:MAG: glycosyltransferase [Thiohalomonadales bacterium]
MNKLAPDLSIIIPVFNEQLRLPDLLHQLSKQVDIVLQFIVVDGGSSDASLQVCRSFSAQHDCLCLNTSASRPMQMNLGAQQANAPLLLFLHADCSIVDKNLLNRALQHYHQRRLAYGHENIAGHFSLQFTDTQNSHALGFYFYAAKTSLNRPDTINGDQGLMISAEFFKTVGCFDDSLHFMEDARISNRIFAQGQWFTLPGTLHTSARRFITEGLIERQILNSLLCNLNYLGLLNNFEQAQSAYRTQAQTQGLRLRPYLQTIHQLMFAQGFKQAICWWYRSGAYVASNAWQLVFNLDCKRHFALNDRATQVEAIKLRRFDKYCSWFFRLGIVKAITGVLTMIWFYRLMLKHRQ